MQKIRMKIRCMTSFLISTIRGKYTINKPAVAGRKRFAKTRSHTKCDLKGFGIFPNMRIDGKTSIYALLAK